jgi:hypothetical protein
MIQVSQVDINDRKQVDRFIKFHYDLYRGCKQWVPPFWSDMRAMLNPKKHPFYEHSDAAFFIAEQDGKIVSRIAALENKPFNQYHNTKKMAFYLFDTIEDIEAARAVIDRACEWGRARGLTEVSGPKGLSAFDGYGIQVEGFEYRQMMTMMNYNYAYYPRLLEQLGFERENDFVSCYIPRDKFLLPEKVNRAAEIVKKRGTFVVKNFKDRKEMLTWADRIGKAYNSTFVNNWEYYPLTEREIKFAVDGVLTVADPKLIKIILYGDEVVGFLFAFPDISAALQRHGGKITPWALVDFLLEMKRTKWVSLNGVGILPEYHGRGGNALLYHEMQHTITDFNFLHAEQTQMADTAVQVRKDMETLGAKIYKVHRIFHRSL